MKLLDQWGNPYGGYEGEPKLAASADVCTASPGEPIALGPVSGYEGAQRSTQRTSFPGFPENPRREINTFTRRELVRKRRALDSNLSIFSAITGKIGQHAVGRGIFVRPLTRDKKWNALNRKRIERKASNPLIYSTEESFDHYEDQRFAAETMVGDGEYFEGLVFKNGERRVQRFDVFEIESPVGMDFGAVTPEGHFWQDGILTDAFDAMRGVGIRELPIGLRNTGSLGTQVRLAPGEAMIHVFRQRRAHQVRDLTWFYSGINNGIDALDTIALEKGSAKLHAALGLVVRKKSGQAGTKGLAGELEKALGAGGQPTRVDEKFWRGAAMTYLGTDEGIDLLCSGRPSPNLLAFLEYLYREIAAALGLPLEIVYKLQELGGATLRAALEAAQWLFDCVQDKVVMRHSSRWYLWDTADAMLRGEIPWCQDPEWWAAAYRGPAKLTVDLGNTADANVLLMRNAALSHVRYFDERAQDAYEEMEEEIQFRQWLHQRCNEAGVDYEELIEPTPGAAINLHAAPACQKAPSPAAASLGDGFSNVQS